MKVDDVTISHTEMLNAIDNMERVLTDDKSSAKDLIMAANAVAVKKAEWSNHLLDWRESIVRGANVGELKLPGEGEVTRLDH